MKFVNLNDKQKKFLRNFISKSYEDVKKFSKMSPLDYDPYLKRYFNELNDDISNNQINLYRDEIVRNYLYSPEYFNVRSSSEYFNVGTYKDPLFIIEDYTWGIRNYLTGSYISSVLHESNYEDKDFFYENKDFLENHYRIVYKHSINAQKEYFSWLKENNFLPTKESLHQDFIESFFDTFGEQDTDDFFEEPLGN